ncbi:MAG: oligosaccharide flippase family protein [Chromatiaceae bacterium]|nr:oligosaccharide flippase family protein [Chromatiaceae bacterium]
MKPKNLAQRLVSGAVWALVVKVFGVLGSLVVSIILARNLPPEEMGAYFLLVSIVAFSAAVARFGSKYTVVRLVAESLAKGLPGRAGSSLKIIFAVVAIGSLLISGLYYIGVGRWLSLYIFELPILTSVLAVTALWIFVLSFQTPVAEIFRGLHNIRMAVLLDGILPNVLFAVILCLLLILGYVIDFNKVVQFSVVVLAGSLLIGSIFLIPQINKFMGDGTIDFKEVLNISWPLLVLNVFTNLIGSFNIWLVAAFLVPDDIALWGVASKLVTMVLWPLLLVDTTMPPVISTLYAKGEHEALQNSLRGMATLAGIPALSVLFVLTAFGDQVLEIVYGEYYANAYFILVILSFGQVVNVWTGSCSDVLAMTGHQKILMAIILATGAFSILIAYIGIKYWAIVGIAVATAFGWILQNIFLWLAVRKLTGLWTHGTFNIHFIRTAYLKLRNR